MKIYHYNKVTKELTKESMARVSPKELNKFLIPAFATDLEPLPKEPGKVNIFINNTWRLVADNRGKEYWNINTGLKTIQSTIDFSLDNFTDIPIPGEVVNYEWNGFEWTQAQKPPLSGSELDKKLRSLFKGRTVSQRATLLSPVLTYLDIMKSDDEIIQSEYDELKTELILGIGDKLTTEEIIQIEQILDDFVSKFSL